MNWQISQIMPLCRTFFFLSIVFLIVGCAPILNKPQGNQNHGSVVIFGTVDRANFDPIERGFLEQHPGIKVTYVEMNSAEIERHVRDELTPYPDVILSSAMDRQMKLANDGHASVHQSAFVERTPGWAKWRSEVFAYAGEPIVMVFSKDGLGDRALPRSRDQLFSALRSEPDFWRGRLATYDICDSATGYLLISHDDRQAGEFTSVVGAMEDAGIRTRGTSVELLNGVADGTFVMGYNVLESYVRAHPQFDQFKVLYPEDYTLVLLRTALINARAQNPEQASIFVDFLLSPQGEEVIQNEAGIWPAAQIEHHPSEGGAEFPGLAAARPIPLTPGLIVYLDERKRRHMLQRFSALCN